MDGPTTTQIAIVGDGIAGASAAAKLALGGKSVIVLEKDGFHRTGTTFRSAALYSPSYASCPEFSMLTQASREAYENPPSDFTDIPLVTPRGVVYVAGRHDANRLATLWGHFAESKIANTKVLEQREVLELVRILNPDSVVFGVHEPDARDMDVDAIWQGYRRQARRLGASFLANAELLSARWNSLRWTIQTSAGTIYADILLNAAGPWGDEVAERSGVEPKGLQPLRRTAMLIDANLADRASLPDDMPFFFTAAEDLYARYAQGRFLISPSDEEKSVACDAQPELRMVAEAIARFHEVTTVVLDRRPKPWAGLRTFARDKRPIVGFESETLPFFWLCGQGGYGIQSADAMARLAAELITTGKTPADLVAMGLSAERLSPRRFSLVV